MTRTTRSVRTVAAAALALTAVLGLGACSGSNPPGPSPVQSPPGPSQANVTVTISNPTYGTSSRAGFNYELTFGARVAESAGLSANLNFIRLEVYDAAANMLERQEIGSSIFSGGNRLNANSARDFSVLMGFNAEPRSGRFVRIAVGTTDDRNNTQIAISERLFF